VKQGKNNLLSWLTADRYRNVYLAGLWIFAAGLPLSKSAMSMALLLLSVHWLISGGFRHFPSIRTSEGAAFYLFMLIPFIHLAGLWNTSDFHYAAKDLRIKMPLLLLPLFVVTAPELTEKHISQVIRVFTLAVLAGTFVSLCILISRNPLDPRDLVPFNSHIRFSMMVSLALFSIVLAKPVICHKKACFVLRVVGALWLLVSILLLESLTGILALLAGTVIILMWSTLKPGTGLMQKMASLMGIFCLFFGLWWGYQSVSREFLPNLPELTAHLDPISGLGNPYFHDTRSPVNENGNLVWIYVAKAEMEDAWNHRSQVAFDSTLSSGYKAGDVLMRYLSSKGLRKDAGGVAALDIQDITLIESGVTNYRYGRHSWMRKRFDQLKWEYWNYRSGGDPRGHSLLQRIELWRVGIDLAKENLLLGVGTGDIRQAFSYHLDKMKSSLAGTPLRTHNQYITILITFGLPGLLLFLVAIAGTIYFRFRRMNVLFAVFLVVLLISMLMEDTLETQVGASLFSFVFSIFAFQPNKKTHETNAPDFVQ
jgi:hypothetical protein